MSSQASFEFKYLYPLVEHGYFASIFFTEDDTACIDCLTYFTDYDAETGSHNLLRLNPSDPSMHEGKCMACNETRYNSKGEVRSWTANSIMCPTCMTWTKPYAMTQEHYRANFKIIPGMPAEFLCVIGPYNQSMPEHMIHCISEALTPAYAEYFEHDAQAQAQARTTQTLLQANEAAEEASIRTEQEEFANIMTHIASHLA